MQLSTAGAACTNVPTAAILITVNPDPSVTITGQNSICGSGSTVLTANPLGGTGTSTYRSMAGKIWQGFIPPL